MSATRINLIPIHLLLSAIVIRLEIIREHYHTMTDAAKINSIPPGCLLILVKVPDPSGVEDFQDRIPTCKTLNTDRLYSKI